MQKSVFITGAGQGLGRELVRCFSRLGYYVYAGCHIKEAELFGDGEVVRGDLSDPGSIREMFAGIRRLDVLINNARFCPSPRPAGLDDADWWDKNLTVSLRGCYLCSLAAMEIMKPQKSGAIINISSIRAVIANDPDRIPYGAAKAGQLNLTTSFAALGAPYGIRVNALLPGVVETENLKTRITPERYAQVVRDIPLGRCGRMEEFCHAAVFLAENTYTTGIALNCSGGLLMT